jgi:meiotically up-regulated gene 157 (Mug157) protein
VVVDSYITLNEHEEWLEVLINKLSEEESKKIKTEFGYNAFRKSQNFESNLIECVAFTWTL